MRLNVNDEVRCINPGCGCQLSYLGRIVSFYVDGTNKPMISTTKGASIPYHYVVKVDNDKV